MSRACSVVTADSGCVAHTVTLAVRPGSEDDSSLRMSRGDGRRAEGRG